MSHDAHESLPGWHPGQLLVDRCGECEMRSGMRDLGISALDPQRFALAWKRAAEWGSEESGAYSRAEMPMLGALFAVQVQLEQRGLRIGEDPIAAATWRRDQASRYMEARYGKNVWFKAPETFTNAVERWIWAVASGSEALAEESISAIEAHLADGH